jgi:hypothetical protein
MGLLDLRLKGMTRFVSGVKKIPKGLKNMRGTNLAAVGVYESWIKRNIDAGGTLHKSHRWKPLAESTIERRRKGKKKRGHKILQDTGALKNRWFREATNEYGKIRSAVEYSSVHEYGKKPVPQRRIFPERKQGNEIVAPVYEKRVQDVLDKAVG